MKRLLWIVVMLVVVFVPCSYADSIQSLSISYVTGTMSAGDDIFFTFIGPGTRIEAFGGMECGPWCYSGYLNPDTSTPIGQVFVNLPFASAILGGKAYDEVGYECCFFASSGGSLNGSVLLFVGSGDTFKEIELLLPGGGWSFNFDYVPPDGNSPGGYLFTGGKFTAGSAPPPVPEPGTLGLTATGLAGITGLIRRKRLIWGRRPN